MPIVRFSGTEASTAIKEAEALKDAINRQVEVSRHFFKTVQELEDVISKLPPESESEKKRLEDIRNRMFRLVKDMAANTSTTSSSAAALITTGTSTARD
ncbi:MAG: hypothetical protein HYR63_13715 [Proteobacteria bacterium]|nr:hypothetical protein [Pseudomonadota bacterium]MBI3497414.1 hypothetical protein [Pseudomonadota bacterium]